MIRARPQHHTDSSYDTLACARSDRQIGRFFSKLLLIGLYVRTYKNTVLCRKLAFAGILQELGEHRALAESQREGWFCEKGCRTSQYTVVAVFA